MDNAPTNIVSVFNCLLSLASFLQDNTRRTIKSCREENAPTLTSIEYGQDNVSSLGTYQPLESKTFSSIRIELSPTVVFESELSGEIHLVATISLPSDCTTLIDSGRTEDRRSPSAYKIPYVPSLFTRLISPANQPGPYLAVTG